MSNNKFILNLYYYYYLYICINDNYWYVYMSCHRVVAVKVFWQLTGAVLEKSLATTVILRICIPVSLIHRYSTKIYQCYAKKKS